MIYRNTYPNKDYKNPVRVKETANQYAKRMIMDRLCAMRECLNETIESDQDFLTEKELADIELAFEKKFQSIKKYLGV